MATPHVAGAAAILAGSTRTGAADQLKAMLMGSAKPNDALTVFEQGAGRVDVAKATTATVFASPASISNGIAQWPHNDDQPIAKTVTYTNTGTEPVTLDFAVDVTGPDGSAAPQGMFTVTPAQLTVPAGGQATATVTTDTTVDAAEGVFSGVITATGGGQSVRTPVAVNREAESYDVTMRFVDHNGSPAEYYSARLVDVDDPKEYQPVPPVGHRHACGCRGASTTSRAPWYSRSRARNLPHRRVRRAGVGPDRDIELVLDAREAKPVGFDAGRAEREARPRVRPVRA